MSLSGARILRFAGEDGRALVGIVRPDAPTTIVQSAAADPLELLAGGDPGGGATLTALDPETLELPPPYRLLAPIVPPETWAAGVTYERSRDARVEESQTEARDAYSLVYAAERPELFLKDAAGRRTVGPGEPIGIRSDAAWSVPEPELGLVLGPDRRPVAVTIGNDVSSRDIEGANPLYLPQAKLFAAGCALGPALLVPEDWAKPFALELTIRGAAGDVVWHGATSTARMRRSFDELVAFLNRDNPVPPGSVLLTGTGIVPPDEIALRPGQIVDIRVEGIGKLSNPVRLASELLAPIG